MATSLSLSQFLSSLLPSKQPIPPPPPPPPPSSLHFPNKPPSGWVSLVSTTLDPTTPSCSSYINPIVCPALAYSNTLYFKSCYNVQVIVGENEPEDKLVGRFRREVLRAGVIQECKRRRYFENTHDKKKRKARDAARRNRKWRPLPKVQAKQEAPKKRNGEKDDNWDDYEVDLPYCKH
ncbi:30S ribosomal protein S21, chloroplastic-like [Quercus robur]|uniref:30S ribosomal protein S21, chloroplastic-like n=1 Tax=Quercus robur TaxID=38942 RepID=UPI002162AE72|nr:30S ribosomal protein S21, chloroplastic-like [Quercus robur]